MSGWYGVLKEAIQQQQNQLVWVSEGKVRSFLLLTHLTTYIREALRHRFSTWINVLEESGLQCLGLHNLHVGL